MGPDFYVFLLIKQANVSHLLQKDRGGFELYPHKKYHCAQQIQKKFRLLRKGNYAATEFYVETCRGNAVLTYSGESQG